MKFNHVKNIPFNISDLGSAAERRYQCWHIVNQQWSFSHLVVSAFVVSRCRVPIKASSDILVKIVFSIVSIIFLRRIYRFEEDS